MPERYSIYEAKAKLSEIIRLVKRNRRVIITERGRDVARVVPAEAGGSLRARAEELAAAGILSSATFEPPAGIGLLSRRRGALERFLASRD